MEMKPKGRCTAEMELMQGMSPAEDSAGVVWWQTSRAPISGAPLPHALMRGSDGGARTVTAIARKTIIAGHFMTITISKIIQPVNVKF